MAEDKFEHRARGGVKPNTFNVTAIRRFPSAFEFETDEHPGWVFGIGGEETDWAYRIGEDGLVDELHYEYGWSNWGPYWAEDPYVFEKFPVLLWEDGGTVLRQVDDDMGYTTEEDYYSVADELLNPPVQDMKLLEAKIGRPVDDKTTWERDND
jgi:hypothetical protein